MPHRQPILSIDTSDQTLGVEVSLEGERLILRILDQPRIHASMLVPTIMEALEECGRTIGDIGAVAVAKGPGSYTGLRIGVSTAKGLAFARDLPLIGIPTMHAIAASHHVQGLQASLVTCLSSRRGEVYAQIWDIGKSVCQLTECVSLALDEASSFLSETGRRDFAVFGSGGEALLASIALQERPNVTVVRTDVGATTVQGVAVLAHKRFGARDFDDVRTFEPFYLKEFIAKKGASPFAALRNRR